MSCYTHKMAIISRPSSVYFVTPLLPVYSYRYVRIIQLSKLFSIGLLFVDEKSRLNGLKQQKIHLVEQNSISVKSKSILKLYEEC